jgi:outer membrane receptor protein involved in Fe transport
MNKRQSPHVCTYARSRRLRTGPAPWLALSVLAGAVGSAYAQSSPASDTQTIVVTAQKRSQTAQSVPVSLTAISGKSLEAAGIATSADLDQVAAGVTVAANNPGTLNVSMRGISNLNGALSAGPAVGFYVDETPLSAFASSIPQMAFWDAERVEVLRGPQGTLFGESSMGGTIRLITNKPDAKAFEARLQGGWSQVSGGGNGYTARAVVNVPLLKNDLALRVSASHQDIIGWIDVPDLGRKDDNKGKQDDARVALRWTPSKQLTLDVSYAHQQLNAAEFFATSPGIYKPSELSPAFLPVGGDTTNTSKIDLSNLTVSYDLGAATAVASVSHFKRFTRHLEDKTPFVQLFFGVPGTARVIEDGEPIASTTAELRLGSNGDQNFNWTAGLYTKKDERATVRGGFDISIPAFGLADDLSLSTQQTKNDASAVFGDVEYKLGRDFALQAGVRYYKSKIDQTTTFDTSSAIFGPAAAPTTGTSKADKTTSKFGLSWKPAADLLVFAKVSQGFRDGGTNYQRVGAPDIPAGYKPESVTAFELGVKSQPLPWLTVNASAYRNDWTDLQLGFATSSGLYGYIANAGKAKADGAEIELVARPTHQLRLGLNLSLIDAKIASTVTNTVTPPSGSATTTVVAQSGNRIPQSAKVQASVSAAYEFPLTGDLGGVLSANVSHRGDTYSEPANRETEKNKAFENVYLRFGVNGPTWGAALYVNNALNSTATNNKLRYVTAVPFPYSSYVQPRTVGVEVNATF